MPFSSFSMGVYSSLRQHTIVTYNITSFFSGIPCVRTSVAGITGFCCFLCCCVQEDESDVSPLILPTYQPAPHPPQQGPPFTSMSSNTTNVVELQPMGGQQPSTIQVVQSPQANDHLWLTMALIFLCFMLGCNWVGAACLLPGLICAAVVC